MSNACYKVQITDHTILDRAKPTAVLYRKFMCDVIDRDRENLVFSALSEKGLGPKLLFVNQEYRIEEFFDGRPITIWEMRSPVIMETAIKLIHSFHYKSEIEEKLAKRYPKNPEKLGVDTFIDDWAPKSKARI